MDLPQSPLTTTSNVQLQLQTWLCLTLIYIYNIYYWFSGTEDKNNNITPLSSENMKAIINYIAPVKLSSENLKQADIKKKANLNVLALFKSKYIDILLKHQSAINIGKHDLGHAKTFYHKIHSKDYSPVYRKPFKIPDSHHNSLTK